MKPNGTNGTSLLTPIFIPKKKSIENQMSRCHYFHLFKTSNQFKEIEVFHYFH
jgi:hypothetical protein